MKKPTITEKEYNCLITNDGYLVSDMFCNPLQVKSEINKVK
jgi:hypothetical protein